ncbi:MAG: hypothetical protein AAF611_06440 [Bacteroidota bacterium]
MKKIFAILILSIVLWNCSSNTEQTDDNLLNISAVTKKQYQEMSKEEQANFKRKYVAFLSDGEPCSCESTGTDSNGNQSSCACNSGNCPDATKPKCHCASGSCDCGCEPYGKIALRLVYTIQKEADSYIFTKNNFPKAITKLLTSNLPNALKIHNLFSVEIQKSTMTLTTKEYYKLEAEFQNLVEQYTPEELFVLEYEL